MTGPSRTKSHCKNKYAVPVWLNSAYCFKIDVQLNSTMRIIAGVVKTTPTRWLPVLCNIHPPNIRHLTTTARECSKYTHNDKLPIHKDTPTNCTLRLKSRKPVCLTAKDLIENQFNGENDQRTNWNISNPDSHQLIKDPCFQVPGFTLKRREQNSNRTRRMWRNAFQMGYERLSCA